MAYISIDTEELLVDVVSRPAADRINVPLHPIQALDAHMELTELAFDKVILDALFAKDEEEGRRVAYKTALPDPWLVVVIHLMWQGLIQGLPWEAIRLIVGAALSKLRSAKVAPPERTNAHLEESSTRIGFSWVEYANDGEKQRDLFIGLERIFRRIDDSKTRELVQIGRSTRSKVRRSVPEKNDYLGLPASRGDQSLRLYTAEESFFASLRKEAKPEREPGRSGRAPAAARPRKQRPTKRTRTK